MSDIPQNLSPESASPGNEASQPGVYEHRESGARLIATNEQTADAFIRLGYVYVRDFTDKDIYVPAAPAVPASAESVKSEVQAIVDEARAAANQILEDAKAQAGEIVAEAAKQAPAPKVTETPAPVSTPAPEGDQQQTSAPEGEKTQGEQ